MKNSIAALVLTLLGGSVLGSAEQLPAAGTAGQSSPVASVGSAPSHVGDIASGILQPSLDALQKTVSAVQLEKWKKGTARDEAAGNISSIQRDLQSTLPGLLKEADAAPRSLSKGLPVSRNLDALYEVLLRVVDGARIAAPGDQFTDLQNVMAFLERSRQTLKDQLQDAAAAQEKQVSDLLMAVKTQAQAVPVCPVATAPAAPVTPPAKKRVVKKKPKPATPPANGQQPANAPASGAAKPNS